MSQQLSETEAELSKIALLAGLVNGNLREALKRLFPKPLLSLPIDVRISSTHTSSMVMALTDDPEVLHVGVDDVDAHTVMLTR